MATAIFLLRHGEAENFSHDKKDASRNLTSRGREDIEKQAKFLENHLSGMARIFHSPFNRAAQSAQILSGHIESVSRVNPDLKPSGDATLALEPLLGIEGNVILVSHLPLIADLAHYLTLQNVRFQPGTLARIDKPDAFKHRGMLAWVRHPLHH